MYAPSGFLKVISHTDEGFGRNVYKNVFFLSLYIYICIRRNPGEILVAR